MTEPLDDFEFDPCDGCGECVACDAGKFPCVVKTLYAILKKWNICPRCGQQMEPNHKPCKGRFVPQ